jgi:hypothetical protein
MYGPPSDRKEKAKVEKTSLRKCIRPLVELSAPGHDELRAYLSLLVARSLSTRGSGRRRAAIGQRKSGVKEQGIDCEVTGNIPSFWIAARPAHLMVDRGVHDLVSQGSGHSRRVQGFNKIRVEEEPHTIRGDRLNRPALAAFNRIRSEPKKGWSRTGTLGDSEHTLHFAEPTSVRPIVEIYPVENAYERMMVVKVQYRVVLTM